jgi:hypothetical protein
MSVTFRYMTSIDVIECYYFFEVFQKSPYNKIAYDNVVVVL